MTSPWASFTDRDIWKAQMEHFERESGGIMRTYLVERSEQLSVLIAMARGDQTAESLASAIHHALDVMQSAHRPPLCLFCDHRFDVDHEPEAFVIFLPTANEDHLSNAAIASPVCAECLGKKSRHGIMIEAGKRLAPHAQLIGEVGFD